MSSFDILEQVEASLTHKKVGIVEFAESDEFCGKRLYPRQRLLLKLIFLEELTGEEEDDLNYWIAGGRHGQEVRISPLIRERVAYLRDLGAPHFREIVLVGGRRSSKGFVTGIAMAKVMYDCLQLQDPGRYYGIDPEKEIYFSCVASAEIQAKKFQYADLVSTVESCKAFENYLAKSLETEFGIMTPADTRALEQAKARNRKVQRHVAKIRGNALASNASTLRGSATMGLVLDEMAHMLPGESRASADQVYDAAVPSLDQFGQDSIIFCNSSPYTKVGKLYERWVEAMRVVEGEKADTAKPANPLMFTLQFPSWALYEGYQRDRRWKKAITVSADWDPEELENGQKKWSKADRAQILIAQSEEQQNPDKYKVERRGQFAEVIDAYLDPVRVDRMFAGKPKFDPDNNEFTREPIKTNWGEGILNIYRYAAHLDPSSTTAGFGFALGHTEKLPNLDGSTSDHVVFDIIKRWQPQDFPGQVIEWETVIDEVLHLAEMFRPETITFDQYQSHNAIQQLRMSLHERRIGGVQVREKTATNPGNWKRAEIFKTALYLDLVHAPLDEADDEYAALELKFLQQKNTAGSNPRVVKQDFGPVQTKDMADCIMEVVEALIGNTVASAVRSNLAGPPSMGAQGGFKIGGDERAEQAGIAGFYNNRRQGEQRVSGMKPRVAPSRARMGPPVPRKLPGW